MSCLGCVYYESLDHFEVFLDSYDLPESPSCARSGTPVPLQRLLFAGKEMEDGDTLAAYNVRKDMTLSMIRSTVRVSLHDLAVADYNLPHPLKWIWHVLTPS